MTVYNHYEFKHIDDDHTYSVGFNAEVVDSIIDTFVQFLHGCGFSDLCIHSYMSEMSDMYFKDIEKSFAKSLKDETVNVDD